MKEEKKSVIINNRMKLIVKISISAALLLVTIFIILKFKETPASARIFSPISDSILENLPFLDKKSLQEVVQDALEGSKGEYSVAIKNLKTGKTFYYNENKVYQSASLYKLWVMASVFEKLKNNKLKRDDILSSEITKLNEKFNIATESAEATEGAIEISTINAVDQMITISHNYSALLLSNKVGLSNISSFLKNEDLNNSKIGTPPTTTAKDILLFYEKLYNKKLVSKEYSQEMLEILKKQKINDRIPKLLPEDTVVAHKTGELENVKHDAGIVFSPNGDYIFVALSKTSYPKGAAERIAQISKSVYDYFND